MTTAVFVHGNPETAVIWGPLLGALDHDDAVTLSPPGFGAPVPDGFTATADGYADWLVGKLERLGRPVDLVGHDWGAGHVMRVAIQRPDLLRSWCIDIAGAYAPDYVWHDNAQIWQTPGAGEEAVANLLAASSHDRAARYRSIGITADAAGDLADAFDADMARCILTLYRSAAQPAMAEIGAKLPEAAVRPGLVIIATEDHYTGGVERARASAARANARVEILDGRGHWWMLEDPQQGAAVLADFWAGLG
jgi:pimeloyl-ACP methyl ester carboxylesterase